MIKAILGVATDNGVSVLKPGKEDTDYVLSSKGLVGRKCGSILRVGDGKLAVGTHDYFVWTSPDGAEWKPSMEGLTRPQVTSLARHPKHKHLVFAGTSPPGVFMSADYGATWKALPGLEALPSATRWSYPEPPYMARVSSIACHGEHNGVIFAGIENGEMAVTKDGGKTWIHRGTGLPTSVRQLAFPAGTTHRVYAATGTGFYRSDDLAGTWKEMHKGLPFTKILAMAVADTNPEVVLLSVSSAAKGGPSTVALSTDGGAQWTVANTGLPRLDTRRVTCLAFGKGGFYAGTDQGELYLLNNMQGKWVLVASNLGAIRAVTALA